MTARAPAPRSPAWRWAYVAWLALGWPALAVAALAVTREAAFVWLIALVCWILGLLRGVLLKRPALLPRLVGLFLLLGILFVPRGQWPRQPIAFQSLDVIAQPSSYVQVTLEELLEGIGRDHGLWVGHWGPDPGRRYTLSFAQPVTHRELLERLAVSVDMDVSIGGHCGTCGGIISISLEPKAGPRARAQTWRERYAGATR